MNKKVKEYINKKQEEINFNKEQTLINLGLYEKEYRKDNEDYSMYPEVEWDKEKQMDIFYRKKAIKVNDDEYEQILSVSNIEDKNSSKVAIALIIIAWLIYIGGFICGICFGFQEVTYGVYYQYTETEFSFVIALTYWVTSFISGTLFLGFSEIIKLLNSIKSKIK